MADTYIKILGTTIVADALGQPITSTQDGVKRSLDVNVTGGEIVIENPTIIVDIDAFGPTPDSVLIVGSQDGTTSGVRQVLEVTPAGNLKTDSSDTIQPVSGPLTDAELRASPVDVLGPLTDTELRAVPVDVLGPLTNAELRASPVAVEISDTNIEVTQGTSPWIVAATDLDIRDLTFAADKVDASGSSVSISNFPATQSVTQGTSPWVISGTVAATQSGTWNINNVSGTVSLPTGAATAALQTQPGVDIGDVTVNNAAGASAVNIQDGGNTITVDGTVTANAGSGTFAISAVSLPLPSGAATSALQTQPGVDIGDVTVNNAAGASAVNIQDGGNTITVDGTVSAAQSGTWDITNISGTVSLPTGAATETTLAAVNAKLPTLATATPTLAASAVTVRPLPYEPQTYSAAASNFVSAATATDVFNIVGSASKTIRIHKMRVTGSTTSGSPIKLNVQGIKRSAANTGGTRVTATLVPHDSTNAAGTANVGHYTANPAALGAAVGTVRASHVGITNAGLSGGTIEWDFLTGQPMTLRGVAEQLCVNFTSITVTGALISIFVEWSEV